MCSNRGWNYFLKARKPVKDGGRNKMYGSCQALQCHSLVTDQEVSIRDCAAAQVMGSAALSPCLSLGQKEETGQVSSWHQLLSSQPVLATKQPEGTLTWPFLPPHHHSSTFPRHTIPSPTLSHCISVLLWKTIRREENMEFSNKLHTSSSLLVCDPVSSVAVWHFIQHTANTHVPLHSS